ncbi:YkgJ family cysteine cluster protein [Pollutimonas sp. H1-120]|uniref:YkgJ family cysteine cluster protein n=1 Tax=Pollutimonas sp. H1-120 TaxID=3148824 RepID=UPI003B51B095
MTDKRKRPAQLTVTGIDDARISLAGTTITAASGVQAHPLPSRIASRRRAAANDTSAANPCLSCGACCAHFRVSFYCGEVAGESGGTVPPELVSQVGPLRACMKGTEYGGQRCVALRGELGQEGIHCAIYEQRPSPCREFPAWMEDGSPNPDCQRLRKAIGLPPLPHRSDDDDQNPTNTPPRRGDVAA